MILNAKAIKICLFWMIQMINSTRHWCRCSNRSLHNSWSCPVSRHHKWNNSHSLHRKTKARPKWTRAERVKCPWSNKTTMIIRQLSRVMSLCKFQTVNRNLNWSQLTADTTKIIINRWQASTALAWIKRFFNSSRTRWIRARISPTSQRLNRD